MLNVSISTIKPGYTFTLPDVVAFGIAVTVKVLASTYVMVYTPARVVPVLISKNTRCPSVRPCAALVTVTVPTDWLYVPACTVEGSHIAIFRALTVSDVTVNDLSRVRSVVTSLPGPVTYPAVTSYCIAMMRYP